MNINMERLKTFVSLVNQKKMIENEMNILKAEMRDIEGDILNEFIQEGITNISVDGRTLYVHKQGYAKRCNGITGPQAAQALEDAGLEEYTTFNTQSLSSELRRMEEEGEPIPPELKGIIEFNPLFSIRSRKKS